MMADLFVSIGNHLWQSTLFALCVAVLAVVLRRHSGADAILVVDGGPGQVSGSLLAFDGARKRDRSASHKWHAVAAGALLFG